VRILVRVWNHQVDSTAAELIVWVHNPHPVKEWGPLQTVLALLRATRDQTAQEEVSRAVSAAEELVQPLHCGHGVGRRHR